MSAALTPQTVSRILAEAGHATSSTTRIRGWSHITTGFWARAASPGKVLLVCRLNWSEKGNGAAREAEYAKTLTAAGLVVQPINGGGFEVSRPEASP